MILKPFRPCIYKENLKELTAPPFDGITPEQEKELKRNPHNITNLTLPRGPDGVEEARRKIDRWMEEGVLHEMEEDTLFVMVQNFRLNSENIERIGVIGVTDVFPDQGLIRPHERTFPGPVRERASLMKGLQAQLEPLFLTVLNNNFDRVLRRVIAGLKADRVFEEPLGVRNSLYFIDDREKIKKIADVISKDYAIVADGHHRLRAAQTLAESATGNERDFWSHSMVYVSSIYDRGLLISGVHRMINNGYSIKQNAGKVASYFHLKDRETIDTIESTVVYDGSFKDMIPRQGTLESLFGKDFTKEDVVSSIVVNEVLFKKILNMDPKDLESSVQYTHDVSFAVGNVDRGKADFSVIMPPWNKDSFIKQALGGNVLPQKSTYFYPKIPSGIAIRKLRDTDHQSATVA